MLRRALALALTLSAGACGETPAENASHPAGPANTVAAPPIPVQRPSQPANSVAEDRNAGADVSRAMVLDPQGLRAVEPELGTGGLLAFGTDAGLAVEALNHVIGAGPEQDHVVTTCGPAPTRVVHWAAGVTLIARDGRFAGWNLERPGFAFANGIQVGSTLRDLAAAFPVSVTRRAADIAFTVANRDGAIGGTLASTRGDARVLSLHAGATCVPSAPAAAPSAGAATPRRR